MILKTCLHYSTLLLRNTKSYKRLVKLVYDFSIPIMVYFLIRVPVPRDTVVWCVFRVVYPSLLRN